MGVALEPAVKTVAKATAENNVPYPLLATGMGWAFELAHLHPFAMVCWIVSVLIGIWWLTAMWATRGTIDASDQKQKLLEAWENTDFGDPSYESDHVWESKNVNDWPHKYTAASDRKLFMQNHDDISEAVKTLEAALDTASGLNGAVGDKPDPLSPQERAKALRPPRSDNPFSRNFASGGYLQGQYGAIQPKASSPKASSRDSSSMAQARRKRKKAYTAANMGDYAGYSSNKNDALALDPSMQIEPYFVIRGMKPNELDAHIKRISDLEEKTAAFDKTMADTKKTIAMALAVPGPTTMAPRPSVHWASEHAPLPPLSRSRHYLPSPPYTKDPCNHEYRIGNSRCIRCERGFSFSGDSYDDYYDY